MRAARSIVFVLAALAACGPRGNPPLSPAGANGDDGVGALARSSTRLVFDGAGDDDEPTDSDDGRYERSYDYDPLAYYGYGSFGYGGFGYAGYGYGGGFGYGTSGHVEPPPYDGRGGSSGAIEGSVTWKADGGVAWPPGCPLARTARSGAPVVGAVVYLEHVTYGRIVGGRTGGVLTQTACGLEPAVQIVGPLPAGVMVENGSATPARLQVTQISRDQVDLDPGGRLELPFNRPGLMAIEVPGGAPAWVFGEAHPYYEITDETGRFALDGVPPGAQTLVIWSPPLVTAVTADGPQWSAPTIERRTIVVPGEGVATVQLALAPAH